jgi:hypothetical protein
MSLLNSRFVLPSPIVLTQVPAVFSAGIQYYTQPSDDCSCGASKTVCPRGESAVADDSPAK